MTMKNFSFIVSVCEFNLTVANLDISFRSRIAADHDLLCFIHVLEAWKLIIPKHLCFKGYIGLILFFINIHARLHPL